MTPVDKKAKKLKEKKDSPAKKSLLQESDSKEKSKKSKIPLGEESVFF
jgi:hypothetical protein